MNTTYFSPKTEKRPSDIDGRGLFACNPISKGEMVAVQGGCVMSRADRDEVQLLIGPAEIQITDDLYIGPTILAEHEGGMIHINHSYDPNVRVQGQIAFVTLRDIVADEELTIDYAVTDDEDYEVECNRGFPPCRRVMAGHDWMRREL